LEVLRKTILASLYCGRCQGLMKHQYSSIDFSRYVAIGDSITAGYADGVLHYEGQIAAYPALLARQYQILQPIDFRQALLDPSSPGIGFEGRMRLVLVPDQHHGGNSRTKLDFLAPANSEQTPLENIYLQQGPFHNLAVPGAKIAHLLLHGYGNPENGSGNFNPFFSRMASDMQNACIFDDVLKHQPTFFTMLIGNNDILSYAMSGGTQDAITPIDGPIGSGFAETLRYLVATLCGNGAKGILCTLPDLTSIPFFNTIAYNDLLLKKDEALLLNTLYEQHELQFKTGRNRFVAENNNGSEPQFRCLQPGDLVLTELMHDINHTCFLSGQRPIPKRYYLKASEVECVKSAISAYNDVISGVAAENGLGVVGLGNLLRNARPERYYDPGTRSMRYFENGAFALDGIHINALGQALLANEFIKTIFRTYGLKIPRLPVMPFRKKHPVAYR